MSVAKRGKKGIWYMEFMINGVRVLKSTEKYSKKEALVVEALTKQRMLDEERMSPQERASKTLMKDAIGIVYESRWKHTKDSKRSLSRALRLVKLMGNLELGKISDSDVLSLIKKLEHNKMQTGTINRHLASLKTILLHFKQHDVSIKLRKERKGRIRTISLTEEKQVVSLLRDTEHNKRRYFYSEVADLAEVLVDTGMRLQELLDLTFEDINFSINLISIWFNKGDRPRSIPMTTRVKAILTARKDKNSLKPFVLEPYQAENAWRWVRKEMGLERDSEFILHALRHTCATRLVNNDIDLYVVKEWLGNSSIQVTERYAHLSPSKLAHAALALE